MKTIYKTIPVMMVMIIIGYPLAMSGLGIGWEMFGFGLIVGSIVLLFGVEIAVTAINWRKYRLLKDNKLSEASQMIIFNIVATLCLFAFVTWNDIKILNDSNMFLIIWMGLNLGALSRLWVPKDEEAEPVKEAFDATDKNNKEA